MKRISIFFIAVFITAAPFVSIAANANDQEIGGLLQKISALVSEIDGLLASFASDSAYAGIVAGVTANTPLPEIIIDNTSSQTKKSGTWCVSTALNFYGTNSIYSCGSGADIFSWIPSLQESAKYEVFMWWTSHPNRSTAGLVQIAEENGSATQKRVNQQIDGGKWNSLGVYTFGPAVGVTAGSGGFVEISDQYGQVAADAVKFVKVESSSPPQPVQYYSVSAIDKTTGSQPLTVTFAATLYNFLSCGNTFIWNFGGTIDSSVEACPTFGTVAIVPVRTIQRAYTFTTPGTYEVSLAVNKLPAQQAAIVIVEPASLKYSKLPIPTNTLVNGTQVLYRFSGLASSDTQITGFRFITSKSGVSLTNLALYAYSDAGFSMQAYLSNPVGTYTVSIGDDAQYIDLNINNGGLPAVILGNTTRYFELRGVVSGIGSSAYLNVALEGLATQTLSGGSGLAPSITVLSPNGGETWQVGSTQTVKWSSQNLPSSAYMSIQVLEKLNEFDSAGNQSYLGIVEVSKEHSTLNSGSVTWAVPPLPSFRNLYKTTGQFVVRISGCVPDSTASEGSKCSSYDESDAPFSIVAGTPSVIVLKESKEGELFYSPTQSYLDINSHAIMEAFYKAYPDTYDFIAVFPMARQTFSYNQTVNRAIKGIGLDSPSISAITKNLKSLVNIDLYGPYSLGQRQVDQTYVKVLIHEIGHYWCCFSNGIISQNSGIMPAHWMSNIDLFGGSLDYNDFLGYWHWTIKNGTEYCVDRFTPTFSSLTLYLMGMLPEENVFPIQAYDFQPRPDTYQPKPGEQTNAFYNLNGPTCNEAHTFTQTRTLTIQDIIAINGKRDPSYYNEKKNFKIAFVVAVPYGTATDQGYVEYVKSYAQPFFDAWKLNTRNISTMNGAVSAPPPPPSVPTTSLSASPLSITSGQSSTLSWSSTNATSCTASGAWSGAKGISGSQAVTPAITSTYTLTCTGSGGSAAQSATVTVSAPPPPPPSTDDIIIDNGVTGTSKTGPWCVSVASGFYGANSLYSCGASTIDTYRWTPALPGQQQYEVSMWWTQHANRSTNVPVKILANIGGVQIPNTVYVNQQIDGGKWNSLGTFLLGAGSYVEVSDKNGQANADAVKFVKKSTATSGKLDVSLATTPVSQAIVRGTNAVHFATIVYNTSFSSEDVRITSQGVTLAPGNGAQASDLNTCQVFDGATPLTSGTNILSPGNATPNQAVGLQFTFDTHLIVPKESIKKVDVKCNVSNSPLDNETFQIGLTSGASNFVSDTYAFGRTSGASIMETVTFNPGPVMTVKTTGMLTVSLDPSSPSSRYGVAGSTDLTAIVLKFHAANEPIKLTKLRVVLGKSAKSTDIVKYTLWDGVTKVGEGVFAGADTFSLATLYSDFIIPKDGDKLLTLKVDLAQVGNAQPGTAGGIIYIGYGPAEVSGTSGVGQSSGNLIAAGTPTDVLSSGIFLVKSFPSVTRLAVPTNTLFNGEITLNRFSVTANPAGDVGLYKVTFKVSSLTSAVTSNFNLYGYSDSGFSMQAYSANPVNWGAAVRQSDGTVEIYFNPLRVGANNSVNIPAGVTRYFELRGNVAGAVSGDVVSVSLEGDEGFVLLDSAYNIDNPVSVLFPQDDFIWSGNTFTTSGPFALDWTNGYAVPGLPSSGMSPQIFSK